MKRCMAVMRSARRPISPLIAPMIALISLGVSAATGRRSAGSRAAMIVSIRASGRKPRRIASPLAPIARMLISTMSVQTFKLMSFVNCCRACVVCATVTTAHPGVCSSGR
jgi:hypothetical protein